MDLISKCTQVKTPWPHILKKNLGLGGAIVNLLLESVPTTQLVHLFSDRYITVLKLAEFLKSRNAHLTGIVQSTRHGGGARKHPDDNVLQRGD